VHAFLLEILIVLFDVLAANLGKKVAVLDFVSPSPRGECVCDLKISTILLLVFV